MKKLLLVFFLVVVSGCVLLPRKTENVPWPSDVRSLAGQGDLDLAWGKERFSGPFVVSVEYPGRFLLEVFGPFGQTVVYVHKEAGQFLLVAGDKKSADESVFARRYGFGIDQFVNDLAAGARKAEKPEASTVEHERYRVEYGMDSQGRRTMTWGNEKASVSLTFDELHVNGQAAAGALSPSGGDQRQFH